MVRMQVEYLIGYVRAVRRAELSAWERVNCLKELAGLAASFVQHRVPLAARGREAREAREPEVPVSDYG
jgi:hypothetical protein